MKKLIKTPVPVKTGNSQGDEIGDDFVEDVLPELADEDLILGSTDPHPMMIDPLNQRHWDIH